MQSLRTLESPPLVIAICLTDAGTCLFVSITCSLLVGRLIWLRKRCLTFHYFIGVCSAFELGRAVFRFAEIVLFLHFEYLTTGTLFEYSKAFNTVGSLKRCLEILLYMCTAATAMLWKKLFIRNSVLSLIVMYYLISVAILASATIVFNKIHAITELANILPTSITYFPGNPLEMTSKSSDIVTIVYCFVKVLRRDTSEFSHYTVKAYRRVACGLAIKTVLMILSLIASGSNTLIRVYTELASEGHVPEFFEGFHWLNTKLNLTLYFWGPWLPVFHAVINCWMISSLLFRNLTCLSRKNEASGRRLNLLSTTSRSTRL